MIPPGNLAVSSPDAMLVPSVLSFALALNVTRNGTVWPEKDVPEDVNMVEGLIIQKVL